jgi:hypothetical protein
MDVRHITRVLVNDQTLLERFQPLRKYDEQIEQAYPPRCKPHVLLIAKP